MRRQRVAKSPREQEMITQEDQLSGAAVQAVSRVLSLTGKGALLSWFLWTLPFRLGCKIALYLTIRLFARPIDFAQVKILGKVVFGMESFLRGLSNLIKPVWYRLFPFEGFPGEKQAYWEAFAEPSVASHQPIQQPAYPHQEDSMPSFSGRGGRQRDVRDVREDRGGRGRDDFSSSNVRDFGDLDDLDRSDYGSDGDLRQGPKFYSRQQRKKPQRRRDPFDSDSQNSFESDPSAKLPRAAANMSAAEVDRAVMLAIEAKQTHNVVEKLFWIAVMLMTIIGIVLVRIDFTRKWGGSKIGNVEPAMGFEGVYGVLVVLTIAFRSDFPFNLGVLMLVVFFAGVVFGTIFARSAFAARS